MFDDFGQTNLRDALAMTTAAIVSVGTAHAQRTEISTSFRLAGYADTAVRGSGPKQTLWNGRLDAFATVKDIWQGAAPNFQLEYLDGDAFAGLGADGVIFPTDIHVAVPRATGTSNATLSFSCSPTIFRRSRRTPTPRCTQFRARLLQLT